MPQTGDRNIGHSGRLLQSPWFAVFLIVLAVAAAYGDSLCGPFVFDDLATVVENPSIRSLRPIWNVLNTPGGGIAVQGRPVFNLTLAVNYAFGREAVVGYHLLNLAIHVLAALVLFGIVRRTLLLPGQAQRLAGQSTGLALAIALVWGVHPLTTAAVTYITQRAESLMALFYLLTLYCVIRSATGDHRRVWQTAAVLLCLLGMASKEVMVSAPLVVLLYDRVFLSRSLKECFQKRGLLYAGLAATWALLAWLVVAAGGRGGTAGFGGKVAWWEYALTQCQAVAIYLKLCFWPRPLVLDYGATVITDPTKVWPQALLLALLLGGVLTAFRWQPWIGFLGVCFFAILASSSSVVPVVTQTIAEHRMYLPLAIVAALSVLLVHQGWGRIWAGREQDLKRWRWAPGVAVAVGVMVLGGLSICRNEAYRTELSIWTDTIQKRPDNARAYNCRGVAFRRQGQFQKAIEDYSQAIALRADYYEAYSNRANIYHVLGQFRLAVADFNQAVALKQDFCAAYINRGSTYQKLGQFRQAVEDFSRAIALQPDCFEAYNNRGNAYQRLGQFDQAVQDYDHAVQLNPNFGPVYGNRALVFYQMKQYDEAWGDVARARELGYMPPEDFLRALNEASARSRN